MKKEIFTKRSRNAMSDTAFAELELSLKEALAYEKGQIDNLRITKKQSPKHQNKGQKPQ